MRVTSPAVTIKAIWDALVADYGVAASYGLLLETNLDAKVSTAKANVSALALEATVDGVATSLATVAGYLDTEIQAIIDAVAAIPTTMVGTDDAALATKLLEAMQKDTSPAYDADTDSLEAISAAFATALLNYTAARAGYLDQLDFNLAEAIAAIPTTMVGTNGAALASAWTAALATILGNFSQARIEYLDQLDFNLQEAVAAIPTTAQRGTDGVDTSTMRGTDSAFLAASLAYYGYSAAIAAGATYKPAQKTIVMVAVLWGASAANDLQLLWGTTVVASTGHAAGDVSYDGFIGSMMMDGTELGYKNTMGSEKQLSLYGVTIA